MSGRASSLRLAFLADDFTGATDALEVLATQGVHVALFARPPTPAMLSRQPDLQAIGLAVASRAMTPEQMDVALPPLLRALRDARPTLVHYKVCSTFDSSPAVGSIGHAIELGIAGLDARLVPVVVGAPSLGRHCVFGNLFARSGSESEPFRLDRHPSMSRHPVTPMDEADLRVHLSRQTTRPVGLIDVLRLERGIEASRAAMQQLREQGVTIALIDLLLDRQLPTVGALLDGLASLMRPGFVVGSSGVESALCEHWRQAGQLGPPRSFPPPRDAGPIVVVLGSRSPVSARQRDRAVRAGFVRVTMDAGDCRVDQGIESWPFFGRLVERIRQHLADGRSVVIEADNVGSISPSGIARRLAEVARHVVERTGVRRLLVAGGDTSGAVASALGIESIEMVASLARGAPLCRVHAPATACDGLELVFKGGQVGGERLFLDARGIPSPATVNP